VPIQVSTRPDVSPESRHSETVSNEFLKSSVVAVCSAAGPWTKNCVPIYLAWAFIEAANFAVRSYEVANRYYHRKASKTNTILARKALAHKLARASFFVMRDQKPFVPERLFG
jgi:hypothetical protein